MEKWYTWFAVEFGTWDKTFLDMWNRGVNPFGLLFHMEVQDIKFYYTNKY